VTEVIARRLGQQYLRVLEAFEAEKLADGTSAVNNIHRWAAQSLASGDIAAVMTTNFDNYLEKAIESLSANYYQVSGDPYVDGREISARLHLTSSSNKLVLIVNGAKSFAFVRSLMPQLGGGKITFLFKLHGSCYDPPSCIDTRLQRAQGLSSFATDILDTLLRRTVWMVAGFSGSDMNDNLDYLRFLSNKRHASIVWLTIPGSQQESAVHRLSTTLTQEITSSTGLCFLSGYLRGERNSAQNKFPRFNIKIASWSQSLGSDWCKLVLVDLIALFEDRSGDKRDPKLLQAFNNGVLSRRDWNAILSGMDLQDQQNQVLLLPLNFGVLHTDQHLRSPRRGTVLRYGPY
jgi:SIR2-like domain